MNSEMGSSITGADNGLQLAEKKIGFPVIQYFFSIGKDMHPQEGHFRLVLYFGLLH